MSSPGKDARLLAIANGFTQVVKRGKRFLVTKNPNTNQYSYVSKVGAIFHYGSLMEEVDTAWVAGVAPWSYQMTKADYNLFALANFRDGQIIKYLDVVSGESITFQPMPLNWTNAQNMIQQISASLSVDAQVVGNVLYWASAYGNGIGLKYIPHSTRLNKLLIIDSFSSLPVTTYDLLELNFVIAFSSGVLVYIDSGNGFSLWDKKTQRDTSKRVEFRRSDGSVLWSFSEPIARDSVDSVVTGYFRFKKQGNSLAVSVRFPKSWLASASYPVFIDPTIDYQISGSADDCCWFDNDNFSATSNYIYFGRLVASYYKASFALRFPDVEIPDDATIDSSILTFYYSSYYGTPPACSLKFELAANPNAVTSKIDGEGRTKTTAGINVTGPASGTTWDTGSLNSIINELRGVPYSYASGASMVVLVVGPSSGDQAWSRALTQNYTGNESGAELHITYSLASSWAGTWGG